MDDLIFSSIQKLNEVKNNDKLRFDKQYLKKLKSQVLKDAESQIRNNTASWTQSQLTVMVERIQGQIQQAYKEIINGSEQIKMVQINKYGRITMRKC